MATRDDLGFLLAKASQRWNELLAERFREAGYREVRPAYGSVLLPLFEEDGLRMGELARRSRLSKQTMTTLVRLAERDGLVARQPDPADARATLVSLTPRAAPSVRWPTTCWTSWASRRAGARSRAGGRAEALLRGVMEL